MWFYCFLGVLYRLCADLDLRQLVMSCLFAAANSVQALQKAESDIVKRTTQVHKIMFMYIYKDNINDINLLYGEQSNIFFS